MLAHVVCNAREAAQRGDYGSSQPQHATFMDAARAVCQIITNAVEVELDLVPASQWPVGGRLLLLGHGC